MSLFVFVPLFAGIGTQTILKKKYGEKAWNNRIKPVFPPFSALGVTLIALVYVIRIQSAAWYVRMLDKVFGKPGVQVRRAGAWRRPAFPVAPPLADDSEI